MISTSLALPSGLQQPRDDLSPEGGSLPVGLMRVADSLLALPIDAIREVVPPPRRYDALPLQSPDLRGVFNLRGDVIPVLDLPGLLGLAGEGEAEHIVVVLRWQKRVLGLLVHKLCGMVSIPHASLYELVSLNTQRRRLSNLSFQMEGEVGSLLDPEQIAALPDIPFAPEQSLAVAARSVTKRESLLLFTVRGSHFAIDASSVNSAVSRTSIQKSPLSMGYSLGVIDHHGVRVPVVDTIAVFEIGEIKNVAESAVVVVEFPDSGLLGFTVDDVRDIVRIGSGDIYPMLPMAHRQAGLFRGLLPDAEGRQHIVLDVVGMHNDAKFLGLATLRDVSAAPRSLNGLLAIGDAHSEGARAADSVVCIEEPYLMYKAGEQRTSLLSQVSEILPMPDKIASFGGGAEFLGLVSHRGVALPLVCLTTFIGGHGRIDPAKARILVVQDRSLAVGFVAEELYAIEMLRCNLGPTPTAQWSSPSMLPELLMFGDPPNRRLVSRIDLFEKLRKFAGFDNSPGPRDLPRLCAA